MNESGNTILITGGANGIGKALAIRFLKANNTVIVCGRDREKLDEAEKGNPGLHVLHSDVSLEAERVQLYEAVMREFPKTNVLINNAAIQRHPGSRRTNLGPRRERSSRPTSMLPFT